MSEAVLETERTGRRGLSLFRIYGIEIRLDYSWLVIFALILGSLSLGYFPRICPDQATYRYWIAGLFGALLFFASILLHEFAHAVVAQLSGIRVPTITLFLFGGVSEMEKEPSKPATEFRIAIVGPLTSFALAALFWSLGQRFSSEVPTLAKAVVDYMAFINLALGIFNMLPGFPLDGGRVLRATIWWRTGSLRRATRIAADAGKTLAVGLMILGGLQILFAGAFIAGAWLVFIGLFMRSMAEAGYQNLILQRALEDTTVRDVATTNVVSVPIDLSIGEFIDKYLLGHGFRAFPVVEGDVVRGLMSVSALKDLSPEQRHSATVGEHMRPLTDGIRVEPDVELTEALKKLALAPGGRLLVMDGNELVGMLTKSALTRFIEIRNLIDRP